MLPHQLKVVFILYHVTVIIALIDIEDNFNEENQIDVTCQQQTNVDRDQLQQISMGVVPEDAYCFIRCRLLKKNYMNEDGILYPELIKKRIYQMMKVDELDKSLDCLETLPPLVECKDVKSLVKCVSE